MFPLFDLFPQLRDRLPRVPLAELPTPVEPMWRLAARLGIPNLYVKRDDITAPLCGGNKVRKLEFLLAEAVRRGCKEVMTFGCAGSNHAAATAIYANQLGLRSISMLLPQPNAHSVRTNLLVSHRFGAELNYYESSEDLNKDIPRVLARHAGQTGLEPMIIPAGGSSPLGVAGYVNAALEFAAHIGEGLAPRPDLIYVAAGTTGTSVGLKLGFKLARFETRVLPVRVTGETFVNAPGMVELFHAANNLLHEKDESVPLVDFTEAETLIRHDFYGGNYAEYTQESVGAMRILLETEGIRLEGTYTGKAFAALLADAAAGSLHGKNVLFWDTYNSRDLSNLIAGIDYHQLPKPLHPYFEQDVQPLDK
ncbi:MAG: pyridoxal-phosphate dependent enzyme [Candidatus Hydrogenedentes bacterium]|nr:pyridoxal-phosphate dependent enzyme [Candidatus Hydrogenedentota bacterium]